ncbi:MULTISPECIES: chaperone NapD [unclassified Sulfurospirillum]|uniref:chaperone NapD n=1 Tax=unclassified Sulfurospirillum TaxID=2618290 RepID=UPI000503A05F|nr:MULTISPECIES: chaperone NapD [unclassified Sulfurospirillum]KFL34921.1 nitrate reductase [Sulfurospirillum sp. SCADC]
MNISSIVIQTKPLHVKEIIAICEASDFCDYHFCDEQTGKIVVTIEGENLDEEMAKMKQIEKIPHVICADMMMAYSEDELDEQREMLAHAPSVPEILNDETIALKDIVYKGDLKKKID